MDELDKIIADITTAAESRMMGISNPQTMVLALEDVTKFEAEAKRRLIEWRDRAVEEALELMLEAEYPAGTFVEPTPALKEFLKKTPLIASYVLRDYLKQTGKGDSNE